MFLDFIEDIIPDTALQTVKVSYPEYYFAAGINVPRLWKRFDPCYIEHEVEVRRKQKE